MAEVRQKGKRSQDWARAMWGPAFYKEEVRSAGFPASQVLTVTTGTWPMSASRKFSELPHGVPSLASRWWHLPIWLSG